jgi:hypothetical protein
MAFTEAIFRSDLPRRWVVGVGAWAVASLLCALAGPLGTFTAMEFGPRLAYWSGLIGVGILFARALRRAVDAILGHGTVAAEFTGAAAVAATLGPSICLFNGLAMGKDVLSLDMLVHHVVVVFTVALGISLVRLHVRVSVADMSVPPQPPAPDERALDVRPAFLREVERETGGRLRWIEADDHYLHVHTTAGSHRVLMRFRDALREVSHLPGLRIHRSHWVALDAFRDIRRSGRRHVAVLSCGQEVPVSRAYLRDLEAARKARDGAA